MAFGTGQHPTTRLSIRLLEKTIRGAEIVADIGTGSGILSIVAVKLGASRVDAVDLDDTTLPIATKNFQLNNVEATIHLQAGNGLHACTGTYDVIVANILTKALLPMIPGISSIFKCGGGSYIIGDYGAGSVANCDGIETASVDFHQCKAGRGVGSNFSEIER